MFNDEIKIIGHHAHLGVTWPRTSSDHGNPYITLPNILKITTFLYVIFLQVLSQEFSYSAKLFC